MDLDRAACDRARRSRDARFDGRFFIGVTTTRIYCRPICPARAPRDEHVCYFASAAAAEAAGFRPCLRCRPEASPGTPAWQGTSSVVSRALRLIADGGLDGSSVEALAARLGVTGRHLRRLFVQHLGASPLEVAATRRLHFAKKLLDETTLGMSEVAAAAGFGSVRRFNSAIRAVYSRPPTAIRRLATRRRHDGDPGKYELRLAYRPPYDWQGLLAFLAARATPGVESVRDGRYRRSIAVGGAAGAIEVTACDDARSLRLAVTFPDPRALLRIVERVRRMFDLAADPAAISGQLGADPLLRAVAARHPGLRVPGAWDPFELAVRAVIGQQISVPGATTIAGRVAAEFGASATLGGEIVRLFPTAADLRRAALERCGLTPARADTIRELASRTADGSLTLTDADAGAAAAALTTIRGIGAWTAAYIAMRALGEPDAFPSGDLVLRRMAGGCSPRELERRAECWRPWRAYAVVLLWQDARDRQIRQARARLRGRTPRRRCELVAHGPQGVGLRDAGGMEQPR